MRASHPATRTTSHCAAHAEVLSRAGDAQGAARTYQRAIALTINTIERAKLERRLDALR